MQRTLRNWNGGSLISILGKGTPYEQQQLRKSEDSFHGASDREMSVWLLVGYKNCVLPLPCKHREADN